MRKTLIFNICLLIVTIGTLFSAINFYIKSNIQEQQIKSGLYQVPYHGLLTPGIYQIVQQSTDSVQHKGRKLWTKTINDTILISDKRIRNLKNKPDNTALIREDFMLHQDHSIGPSSETEIVVFDKKYIGYGIIEVTDEKKYHNISLSKRTNLEILHLNFTKLYSLIIYKYLTYGGISLIILLILISIIRKKTTANKPS